MARSPKTHREELWAIPPYAYRFRPGDLVQVLRHSFVRRAIIAYQSAGSLQACTKCARPGCVMWRNLITDGGECYFNVGECELRLSALGQLCRRPVLPPYAAPEESPGAERASLYKLGRSPSPAQGTRQPIPPQLRKPASKKA